MTLDQVWNLGYYTAWRLWFVLDELKARDLTHFVKALDASQGTEDYRREFSEWLSSRQPRTFRTTQVPKEVLERFERMFNDG